MKKLLLSAGVAALFAVAGVAAQAADQDIVISAEVEGYCTIDGSAMPAADPVGLTVTDGNVDETAIPVSYPVVCNAAATATLTSLNDGLTGPGAATGFANVINYSAGTSGFVTIAPAPTTGGAGPNLLGTDSTLGASALPVTVTITPIDPALPLVASDEETPYSDTLTLSINPT